MINYEKYAELRDSKGLKDSDIAKITNIPQSTFTAWKKGDYIPTQTRLTLSTMRFIAFFVE